MFAPDLHKDRGTPKIMPKHTGYDVLAAASRSISLDSLASFLFIRRRVRPPKSFS